MNNHGGAIKSKEGKSQHITQNLQCQGAAVIQPLSCYQMVAGSIPLACMSKYCGQDTVPEPQTAPGALVSTLHGSIAISV